MNKKSLNSYLWLIGITLIWGTSFPVIEEILKELPAFTLSAYRYLGAGLIMNIIFFKRIKGLTLKEIKYGTIIGIPWAIGAILQVLGMETTNASNAAFITGLGVAVVPIIMFLAERHKTDLITLIGILIALCGLGYMTLADTGKPNIGDVIVFIGMLAFAVQYYIVGKLKPNLDVIRLTTVQMYVVGLISLPFAAIFDGPHDPMSLKTILLLLFLIIFCAILATTVQNKKQPLVETTHASLIYLLEPVSATGLAFLLGDMITRNQIIGGVIITLGALVVIMSGYLTEKILAMKNI